VTRHDDTESPFVDWQAVLDAPRPRFSGGHTADTVRERAAMGPLTPHAEALFTQSNARVLVGQAANGMLRLLALPTRIYPAPTGEGEFGLGPGMYHHFDVAMYAGGLSYQLDLDGEPAPVDLAADERDNETAYTDHFLPLTHARCGELDATILTLAPVAWEKAGAPLFPAPLPGPAGALYVLRLRNEGKRPITGHVRLIAGDLLVGHYEDAEEALRPRKRPTVDLRQQTLILTRPDGSVGIHLHGGHWAQAEVAPYQAECALSLTPGAEAVIETHVALGASYQDVMPTVYALHLHPALEWLNRTAVFWRERLGRLTVGEGEAAELSRELYLRCVLDNINCLQVDDSGNLVSHWQGAPSHGYGTLWGIDVEPTALSVLPVCPELARRVFEFFAPRSRAPRGPADHSVPILVAPVIIARKWLQATGDVAYFHEHPDTLAALQGIMDDLMALKAPDEPLFPSRHSSDGPVGRRYDYGTNAKVHYALDSWVYLLRQLERTAEAERYTAVARAMPAATARWMIVEGPFGPQLSGGTNLGQEVGRFYLPEGRPYYDGEDTSTMLAPLYGLADLDDEPWLNTHRFARSLWCPNYDPEFDALRWSPGEMGVVDGTAFFSRLGGSRTRSEMLEALETLRQVALDEVTGSVFWWPHGLEYKRGLTRCSQGQGAWAWQYLEQWLGLKADAATRTLTIAPRGALTRLDWRGAMLGGPRFDVYWAEEGELATLRLRNLNAEAWTVCAGFRPQGAGAEGPLTWQTQVLLPGQELTLSQRLAMLPALPAWPRHAAARLEAEKLGDAEGVLFHRFGPALLWGHWNASLWWKPQEMPLALRFVVANGTDTAWKEATVKVTCPPGWLIQGRAARHWEQPERLAPSPVSVILGELAPGDRAVAAFWVRGPHLYDLASGWDATVTTFHAPSQPGPGWALPSPEVMATEGTTFEATLRAVTADEHEVQRTLRLPVRTVPSRHM